MTCRVPQSMKYFTAVFVVKIPDFKWQGTAMSCLSWLSA